MIKEKIDVCIVDDHQLVRKGLVRILNSYENVGEIREAENGKDLLNLLRNWKPDVVLLDLQMPVMGGLEACDRIHKEYPEIKIVILTMNDQPEMVELLIRTGAHGFLSKSVEPDEVYKALNDVMSHGFYTNDHVFHALRSSSRSKGNSGFESLTNREIEIIRLICEELTMKEIANKLHISEKTVQNHRTNIMTKIKVTNTAGLVKYAVANKIITILK